MANKERPANFEEAMQFARAVTDSRSEFEIYLGISKTLVARELADKLKELPISDKHKAQLINGEAYKRAQPAHLNDVNTYEPVHLLTMLEQLGVLEARPPVNEA